MSDPRREQPDYQEDEESDFGAKLKVRLAIAGGLVALALGAIPLLDNLTGKKPQPADNNSGSISGIASAPLIASTPVASAPVASAPVASAPAGTAPTGPDLSQTPGMTATPPLSLPQQAPEQAAPHRNTAARPAATPATPAAAPAATRNNASHAYRPGAGAPQPYTAGQPPYAAGQQPYRPATQPAGNGQRPLVPQNPPPAAAMQPLPAARPAGSSVGYHVQLGVFNSMENAQKLIAELKSKGIEVQSETRVHLAPFRTRAEAEQAMAKLRAMGYAPILNTPGN